MRGVFFLFGLVTLLFNFSSCQNNVERPKDKNALSEIKIGKQIWSSNLNIKTDQSICNEDCSSTGRLYAYREAIKLEQQYDGWELPLEEDWTELEKFIEDKNERSSDSYKSGADKLKKIKGFDQFPGYAVSSKEMIYPGEWGAYWVKDTYTTEQYGIVAYARVLKTKGNKPNMVYKILMGVDTTNYLSVKLIKR